MTVDEKCINSKKLSSKDLDDLLNTNMSAGDFIWRKTKKKVDGMATQNVIRKLQERVQKIEKREAKAKRK
jgi:hypothetical protein